MKSNGHFFGKFYKLKIHSFFKLLRGVFHEKNLFDINHNHTYVTCFRVWYKRMDRGYK